MIKESTFLDPDLKQDLFLQSKRKEVSSVDLEARKSFPLRQYNATDMDPEHYAFIWKQVFKFAGAVAVGATIGNMGGHPVEGLIAGASAATIHVGKSVVEHFTK